MSSVAPWQLLVDRDVGKQLARIPKRDAERILTAITDLVANPYSGGCGRRKRLVPPLPCVGGLGATGKLHEAARQAVRMVVALVAQGQAILRRLPTLVVVLLHPGLRMGWVKLSERASLSVSFQAEVGGKHPGYLLLHLEDQRRPFPYIVVVYIRHARCWA